MNYVIISGERIIYLSIINSLIYSYEENIEELVINKTYYLK